MNGLLRELRRFGPFGWDGNFLPFNEFKSKYSLEKNLLQYYQVVSAIPNHLLQKTRELIAFSDGTIMNDD